MLPAKAMKPVHFQRIVSKCFEQKTSFISLSASLYLSVCKSASVFLSQLSVSDSQICVCLSHILTYTHFNLVSKIVPWEKGGVPP